MAYIAFASAKGSPGVTTTVAALAASWPAERGLLVAEVDPAGGDLVVRLDLATEPGLVSLAAAGRRELDADRLIEHTQLLPAPGDAPDAVRRALVAPVSADQASASLSALRGGLARVLDQVGLDVIVDCGRLDPSSPAFDLANRGALLVMVARPVVAEVHHLSSRLAGLGSRAVSLLMVGDRPYSVSEVGAAVGASPLGTLPVDVRAAGVLTEGHPNAARLLRRAPLLRDARALAEGLCEWLGPQGASASPSPAPHVASPSGAGPSPAPRREAATSPAPAAPNQPADPPPPTSAPVRLPPPTTAPVPLPPPAAHDPGRSAPAGPYPPGAPAGPARSAPHSPPPARFTPTLPSDDASSGPPSAPAAPLSPGGPSSGDVWPAVPVSAASATPGPAASGDARPAAASDRAASGGSWPAAASDRAASGESWPAASGDAPSGRSNGRRRLGAAPKHFRRSPEEPGR